MDTLAGRLRLTPMKLRIMLIALLGVGIFIGSGAVALAQGAEDEVARTGVNFSWTLMAGFLVFFMQAGFAFLGAGLIRSKSTVNYMTKSFMDFCIASLSFWAFGFALMFGGSAAASGLSEGNAFIGTSGFFLAGDAEADDTAMLWLFQMMFAGTAATIIAGAMAERTRINAYLAYSFMVGAIIYPLYGHWVWSGNGWLATLSFGAGAKDFAGSGVVHTVGGMVALAGAMIVGPRIGKFNADGTANEIKGHNLPYVVFGTFILFFGWFGFNAGSTLLGTDTRIATIATNTLLAGATGAVVALYVQMTRTGKADVSMACNGALAGLVGITAPCAYVAPWAAVVIGGIGAVVMMSSLRLVERVLRVDDPVGAVSVHGAAGLWGLLAVGIFADGSYGGVSGLVAGEGGQIVAQLISMVVVVAWAFATGYGLFWVLDKTMGLRASREEELEGLDMPEHGILAYPEEADKMMPAHGTAGDD
ncbi:MAG: ammonium transporter [Chloroflexi bacterium]|nr:ammonium transporter [Chloroflexota bacterium]